MDNTPFIVQNQVYILCIIPKIFDLHFNRSLAVQILLVLLLDSVVEILYGLHAMCHFLLIFGCFVKAPLRQAGPYKLKPARERAFN